MRQSFHNLKQILNLKKKNGIGTELTLSDVGFFRRDLIMLFIHDQGICLQKLHFKICKTATLPPNPLFIFMHLCFFCR